MATHPIDTRERLLKAALRRISADYQDGSDAHFADEQEYSSDELDRAAREHVAALDAKSSS